MSRKVRSDGSVQRAVVASVLNDLSVCRRFFRSINRENLNQMDLDSLRLVRGKVASFIDFVSDGGSIVLLDEMIGVRLKQSLVYRA